MRSHGKAIQIDRMLLDGERAQLATRRRQRLWLRLGGVMALCTVVGLGLYLWWRI